MDLRFRGEVLAMHRFLDRWLKGETPRADGRPWRLEEALAEDFFVIHPSGLRQGRAEVIRNFADAYGEKPAEYTIEIDALEVRTLATGLALAIYTESHCGEAARARICTALLRQRPAKVGIEWLHLHETLINGPPGTTRGADAEKVREAD